MTEGRKHKSMQQIPKRHLLFFVSVELETREARFFLLTDAGSVIRQEVNSWRELALISETPWPPCSESPAGSIRELIDFFL